MRSCGTLLKPFTLVCGLALCLPAGTARGDSFEMESLSSPAAPGVSAGQPEQE